METREDNYEETKNNSPDAEILENDEETTESIDKGTEETNETSEETTEDGEETSSETGSELETQVLVSVNTNHGLDENISSFSFETIVLTIIMLILGAMLIGGFYHEQ